MLNLTGTGGGGGAATLLADSEGSKGSSDISGTNASSSHASGSNASSSHASGTNASGSNANGTDVSGAGTTASAGATSGPTTDSAANQSAPPPTASAQQIAAVEMTLADPLVLELVARYCPAVPTSLPDNATSDALVAQFGFDRACRLYQASIASRCMLDDYCSAMDRAAGQGPGASGWVFTEGTPGHGEQDGTAGAWTFDPVRFTADYARGDSVAQRAFAALHGTDGRFAQVTRTLAGSGDGGEVYTTTSGGIDAESARFRSIDLGDGGSEQRWEAARIGDGLLTQIDLADPREMLDPSAVWFDPRFGLVTRSDNIIPEDTTIENVVIAVVAAVVTAGFGYAAGIAANTIGGAAALGGIGAVVGGLFQNGTVRFEDVLRGVISGAVMGAVTNGLNKVGIDPATGAVVDWPARIGSIATKAGVQGLLSEVFGGDFKDAFGSAFVSGLVGEIGRGIDGQIDQALRDGTISSDQAGEYRGVGRIITTALRSLSGDNPTLAAFAQTYLADVLTADMVVKDQDTIVARPGDEVDLGASKLDDGGGDVLQIVVDRQHLPRDADNHQLEIDAQGRGYVHLDGGGVVLLGQIDPLLVANLTAGKQYDGSFLAAVGTVGVQDLWDEGGSFTQRVTGSIPQLAELDWKTLGRSAFIGFIASASSNELTPSTSVAQVSSDERFVVSNDQVYGRIERRDANGDWQVVQAGVQYLPAGDGQRYLQEIGQSHGQLQARNEHGQWETVKEGVKVYTDPASGGFVILTDQERAQVQGGMANPTLKPGEHGSPGYEVDERDTSNPGTQVSDIDPGTGTTQPIERQTWEELIVQNRLTGHHGPEKPSNWDALTSSPEAHALSVHGGSVTEADLMTRARTGVRPDGTQSLVPPFSTAFHSDALLIETDFIIRNSGALQNAIARQPGELYVRVETQDVGDLGKNVGYGYVRLGASANGPFNADAVGPLQRIDNLNSAVGVYKFNSTTGVWETITLYPSSK